MPTPRELGAYDLFLEYDCQKYGLILHRDSEDQPSWFPGLAPDLQPQFNTGDFGYENVPSNIDIPVSLQNFGKGAGFQDDPDESPNPVVRAYSYSRCVDASEGDRAYLGPLQVNQAGISACDNPIKYWHFSEGGVFLVAGNAIYEYIVACDTWTSRQALADGDGTDIVEFNGVMYVAQGSAGAYYYSTCGTSWTKSTLSCGNPRPKYWTTRDDVLWYVDSEGQVANTTNGINGGVAWSAEDNVGHSSETTRGILELDGDLYIYKCEGIYRYTGTLTEDVWLGGRTYRRPTNGLAPYVWVDGNSYVPYHDRLLRFRHGDAQLDFVFPTKDMRGHPELNGTITAVTGDGRWLYLMLKNAAGNTYLVKGNPYRRDGLGEWHTYSYLEANDSNAMTLLGPTADFEDTNNPHLLFQKGTGASADTFYITLPRTGLRPEDCTTYKFATCGKLYASWNGAGTRAFPKFLNEGRVVGGALGSACTIRLDYEIDSSQSEVEILTATVSGHTSANICSTVSYERVRGIIKMARTACSTCKSPILHASVLHSTPNPPRRHSWTFFVDVADRLELRGGGQSRYSGRDLEAFLFQAATKRPKLFDRTGRSFVVRVLDVQTVAGGSAEEGNPSVVQTTMAEAQEGLF